MLAMTELKLGRAEEALAAAREALALDPESANACSVIGMALLDQGRIEEAQEMLRRALELNPADVNTWFQQAGARRFGEDDLEQIRQLEALIEAGGHPDEQRSYLHFAVAKMYNDCRRYDDAFRHYQAGNELAQRTHPHGHDEAEAYCARSEQVFDGAYFERVSGLGVDTPRPLFIVGMPRSGTTLVEQILASHPRVAGGGELDAIPRVVRRLAAELAPPPYPACLEGIGADRIQRAAAEYLGVLDEVSSEAERVTDKLPGNYLHLGLIATLLPGARVVHCRRDPRDTCLSNYFQRFAEGHHYSYDLAALGRQYRLYERLMAHWRAVLPLPILEVEYEALVGDLEAGVRRLLKFAGLPFDERCLRFWETERTVSTASHWQVRQRVYRGSVGRWRRYARHLGPLLEALGMDGEATSG